MLVPAGRFLECQVYACYEPAPFETLARQGWYYFKAALAITLAGAAVFSVGAVQRHRRRTPSKTRNNVAQD